jgi:hypothetical protein
MHSSNVIKAPRFFRRTSSNRQIRDLLLQKLWLPRIVYELLPYFYLSLGLTALASATHMRAWVWILPYAILLGLICIHVGLALITLRYRYRHRNRPSISPQMSGSL